MSFCQACGGKNAEDARFCNLCGARIVKGEGVARASAGPAASPSTPHEVATKNISSGARAAGHPSDAKAPEKNDVWAMGGSGSAAGPSRTGSLSDQSLGNQTLAGVGIPSQRRTYGILALVAMGFFSVGALLVWTVMHGESNAEAEGDTVAEGEIDPETGLPLGVDVPDDEHFLEGTRVVRGGGSTGGGSTGGGSTGGGGGSTGGDTTGGGSTGGGSGSTGGGGSDSTGSGSSTSRGGGTGGGGSTGGGGGTGGGSTGGGGTGGGGSTGSGTGTTTPAGPGDRDWDAMAETVGDEEANHELNLYVTGVRRFIRNNYARQAGACFSHATAAGGGSVTGTVTIGFTISGTGSTEDVHVVSNPSGIATLGSCLVNRVDSWALPAPPRREPLELAMPFTP